MSGFSSSPTTDLRHTGAVPYRWLNEHLFAAEGRLAGPSEIEYAIYRAMLQRIKLRVAEVLGSEPFQFEMVNEVAHRPNESIGAGELEEGRAVVERLVRRYCL